jgi:hypothetical protein
MISHKAESCINRLQDAVLGVIMSHRAGDENVSSDVSFFEELEIPEHRPKMDENNQSIVSATAGFAHRSGPERRITPLSYMECNQAASGLDLNPQTFTRSKSDAAIIAHEMPIMRTKSSSEVLGQRESSEWDDSYAMETTTAVNKRSIMGVVGQVNVLNPPHMIKGAKLDRNASPYIKVLCRFSNGENEVGVVQAPVKTMDRMREKLLEYIAHDDWEPQLPLAAYILDPIRTSIVCSRPADIIQVLDWLCISNSNTLDSQTMQQPKQFKLQVSRVKNKFGLARKDTIGGYRDLMISVIFTEPRSGLRIIGEIQIHDRVLFALKNKMHHLYKIIRASSADKIT